MTSLGELFPHLVGQIKVAREARLRRLPKLHTDAVARSLREANVSPQVFYLCPDNDRPSGGIRMIYRHVDALNSAGIRAVVLHHQSGFACSWFEHNTPVMGAKEAVLTPCDVLVVPEFYGASLSEVPAGPRIVIFNQNAYQTFAGVRSKAPGAPYRNVSEIEAILVVSHDNADYLRYAFPDLRVERVRNVVDRRIFYPSSAAPSCRLAVMPRRRTADSAQVMRLLRARGCLNSWEVVTIDGRSERETAEALRSCAIFLSFSEQEGFGMPPAEAMACGCYVIGFTGLGGREIFDPATSTPIEEGDVLAFAKAVERALLADAEEQQAMRRRALAASARILANYSLEGQRSDLLAFFGWLFSRHTSGSDAQPPTERPLQATADYGRV